MPHVTLLGTCSLAVASPIYIMFCKKWPTSHAEKSARLEKLLYNWASRDDTVSSYVSSEYRIASIGNWSIWTSMVSWTKPFSLRIPHQLQIISVTGETQAATIHVVIWFHIINSFNPRIRVKEASDGKAAFKRLAVLACVTRAQPPSPKFRYWSPMVPWGLR